jgi:hypothetical protein
MTWIYPSCVKSKNIKGKNIENKKRGKPKCEMEQMSKKNTVVCPRPHSSYMLSEFLYPIFSHSTFLPIFLTLMFRYFHFLMKVG